MMIFNRKELYIGDSLKRLDEIRSILEKAGIRYKTRTKDRFGQSMPGGTRRSVVPGMEPQVQYIVYVHKKDYEKAAHLTGSYTRIR